MAIYQLGADVPAIDPSAYVADSANVIGKVALGAGSSVWFGSTLRGDNEWIRVGQNSNIQENCALHTDMGYPLSIGDNVTVGHQAVLHGCSIGEGSLVGIGAIILNGAQIGKNCLVGAGALVTEGKVFPDNSLIVGAPAKALRSLDAAQSAGIQANAAGYTERARLFKSSLRRVG